MGWSEVVYFNVFYAVLALLVVVGVVSLLHWFGAGIEQLSAWLARVLSPKVAPDLGAEAIELSQVKAMLARNGSQAIGRQSNYQTKLARLSLENCRFRKEIQNKTARIRDLEEDRRMLERRLVEVQARIQPLQMETDKRAERIASLEDQLAAREMELDAIGEAYVVLIESHEGELKHVVKLLESNQLNEVTLKRGRTYLKRDIKTMRKLLIDLEAIANGLMSGQETSSPTAATRTNGHANGAFQH